jgi:putative endonuclease
MDSRLLGAKGEQYAARYLRQEGYDILSGNFSLGTGEIDIVAFKNDIIHFVEVKTRTAGGMTSPAEAVDYKKQGNLKSSAAAYITKYKLHKYKYFFDIIEVFAEENGRITDINFIENAF